MTGSSLLEEKDLATEKVSEPPKRWRVIPGFPKYEVSDHGDIRTIATQRVRKLTLNPFGYHVVGLRRQGASAKIIGVHRLVVMAFVGPIPSGMTVNHKNGAKTDNRVENLEVMSREQNYRHGYDMGLVARGSANGAAKLNEASVRLIRASPLTSREIAKQLGVSHRTVLSVRNGDVWGHIEGECAFDFSVGPPRDWLTILNDASARNLHPQALARELGCSPTSVASAEVKFGIRLRRVSPKRPPP